MCGLSTHRDSMLNNFNGLIQYSLSFFLFQLPPSIHRRPADMLDVLDFIAER